MSCNCTKHTSALVATGLVGGFAVARYSGKRELGGLVLGAAGLLAGKQWLDRKGPATAGVLAAVYMAAFGGSHPLAKKIGAWPSVFAATAVAAGAAHCLGDRD